MSNLPKESKEKEKIAQDAAKDSLKKEMNKDGTIIPTILCNAATQSVGKGSRYNTWEGTFCTAHGTNFC